MAENTDEVEVVEARLVMTPAIFGRVFAIAYGSSLAVMPIVIVNWFAYYTATLPPTALRRNSPELLEIVSMLFATTLPSIVTCISVQRRVRIRISAEKHPNLDPSCFWNHLRIRIQRDGRDSVHREFQRLVKSNL